MKRKLKIAIKCAFLLVVALWAVFPITIARTANFGGYDGFKLVGGASTSLLMVSASANSSSRLEIQMGPTLWYQPTTMLSGAILPDRIATQNGTINWGSNSELTITYGEMSSSDSFAAVGNATGGFEMPSAPMPETWFAAGENLASLPLYDVFSNASVLSGQPVQTLYALAVIGVAFGAFLAIVMFTRSALLAYIAMVVVFAIGSSMTIIPAWIVFVLIIIGGGIMYLSRQVAY